MKKNFPNNEPSIAFPYSPPTNDVKIKYAHIFEIDSPLRPRLIKLGFDKLVAAVFFALSLPILLLLKIAYVIEGIFIPENKGPMFFFYWGVSGGKMIKKWKIRLIKQKFIEPEGAARHEWIAFSAEWTPSRTFVGAFVKKWYLDELPILECLNWRYEYCRPRPLSVMHYERDKAQGNVVRSLLKEDFGAWSY